MRIHAPAAIVALLSVAAAPAPGYDALVASAQSDPAHADYTALRTAYAASPGFDPDNLATHDSFARMWKAFTASDCTTALASSDEVLKVNFTYMAAHAVRSDCFNRQGKPQDAERERLIGRGLADSILASGDGRSPKSAFVVVTLDEERLVLAHLGVREQTQALISNAGHYYDLIQGPKATGGSAAIYFQIDAMVAGEGRQLKR